MEFGYGEVVAVFNVLCALGCVLLAVVTHLLVSRGAQNDAEMKALSRDYAALRRDHDALQKD